MCIGVDFSIAILVGPVQWLETHIWHAKRMHMTELWGYRLVCRISKCVIWHENSHKHLAG